jgi:hypothetical protein
MTGFSWTAGPTGTDQAGADGLMVQEVLGSYPEAAAADLVPDRQALLLLYPHLADVIGEFFAEEDRVGNPSHTDR